MDKNILRRFLNKAQLGDAMLAVLLLAALALSLYFLVGDRFFGTVADEKPNHMVQKPSGGSKQGATVDKSTRKVIEQAEKRLDQVEAARIKQEAEREERQQEREERIRNNPPPLTDVAPSPSVVDVRPEEHPYQRLEKMQLDAPPQYKREVKLPDDMDVHNPPQWTKPLDVIQPSAKVPDPFVEPPLKVDPRRVPPQ